MNQKLFIPTKIKVGYQKRDDTYTKKLAYVIYFDEKGVLRKQTSWENWRDEKIAAEEFENKPHSGFVLNKGIQRDGYWGGGHNMVRIYDDRGIEFEITISNLMFILMGNDCNKRALDGEFVYAWDGKELILLPTNTKEYEVSTEFTSLKGNKVSAKDMAANIGCLFMTKSMDNWVYLGKLEKNERKYSYDKKTGKSSKSFVRDKVIVFYDIINDTFIFENNFAKISHQLSTEKVDNLESLFEKYFNSPYYVLYTKIIVDETNSKPLGKYFTKEESDTPFNEDRKTVFFADNNGNYYQGYKSYYFYPMFISNNDIYNRDYRSAIYPLSNEYRNICQHYEFKTVEMKLQLTNGNIIDVTPDTINQYFYEKK